VNVTVFFVCVCGGEYRDEIILNIIVFVAKVCVGNIEGTDTECYCVFCVCLWRGI